MLSGCWRLGEVADEVADEVAVRLDEVTDGCCQVAGG